jgi:hypothetical protein
VSIAEGAFIYSRRLAGLEKVHRFKFLLDVSKCNFPLLQSLSGTSFVDAEIQSGSICCLF